MTRTPPRGTSAGRSGRAVSSPGDAVPLTAAAVWALQGHRADPSVSLLLTTRPGPELDPLDRARLRGLAEQARHRLAAHPEYEDAPGNRIYELQDALDALAERVRGPVDQSLALFCSAVCIARFDLPVEVVDRCVIDPTFATRDLIRALHRTPRHVVLLLAPDQARLRDGAGGVLSTVRHGFPRHDRSHRRGTPARESFLREVDQALGAYRRLHPAPLVVAADPPTLAAFRTVSVNTDRLAGTLPRPHLDTPPEQLQARVRPVIEDYLLSRQAEALTLLARRGEQQRVVRGITRAWRAARWERPKMLAVEQGYFQPAHLTDGDTLVPVDTVGVVGAPGVLDDAVDELIEMVLGRGGWIALLADGTLPATSRVALTLHT